MCSSRDRRCAHLSGIPGPINRPGLTGIITAILSLTELWAGVFLPTDPGQHVACVSVTLSAVATFEHA